MSAPLNPWDQIERYSEILDEDDLLESIYESDVNDNPIYVGYTPYVSPLTSSPVFYIVKIEYNGTVVTRKRLPINGVQFSYIWDNRASYFV